MSVSHVCVFLNAVCQEFAGRLTLRTAVRLRIPPTSIFDSTPTRISAVPHTATAVSSTSSAPQSPFHRTRRLSGIVLLVCTMVPPNPVPKTFTTAPFPSLASQPGNTAGATGLVRLPAATLPASADRHRHTQALMLVRMEEPWGPARSGTGERGSKYPNLQIHQKAVRSNPVVPPSWMASGCRICSHSTADVTVKVRLPSAPPAESPRAIRWLITALKRSLTPGRPAVG